jgi:hypothetical protein
VLKVPTIVRQQALLLGLCMLAGILSATAGSITHAVQHMDGRFVFFPLLALLFALIFRYGPPSWR